MFKLCTVVTGFKPAPAVLCCGRQQLLLPRPQGSNSSKQKGTGVSAISFVCRLLGNIICKNSLFGSCATTSLLSASASQALLWGLAAAKVLCVLYNLKPFVITKNSSLALHVQQTSGKFACSQQGGRHSNKTLACACSLAAATNCCLAAVRCQYLVRWKSAK